MATNRMSNRRSAIYTREHMFQAVSSSRRTVTASFRKPTSRDNRDLPADTTAGLTTRQNKSNQGVIRDRGVNALPIPNCNTT
jgi:hypothetical protein